MYNMPFTGQLNPNELYATLSNWVLSQRIYDVSSKLDPIVTDLKAEVGFTGDSIVRTYIDVTGTYEFEGDAGASRLLEVNRNNRIAVEQFVIDQVRQTNITVSQYLDRRAFMEESGFTRFNGILIGLLSDNKNVYDTGYVKTFIGTTNGIVIPVSISDLTASTTMDQEAKNRLTAQRIAKALAKITRDIGDDRRDYNQLGAGVPGGVNFLKNYDLADATVIWNGDQHDSLTLVDLPTMFHKDGVEAKFQGVDWTPYWFGNVGTTAVTTNGTQYWFGPDEVNSDGTTEFKLTPTQIAAGVYRIQPGQKLPTGFAAAAGSYYVPDSTVVCKIIFKEALPYLGQFQTSGMFFNARSLTENHYLTYNFNSLAYSKGFPMITITLTGA